MIPKKIFEFATLKRVKVNSANLPPGKIYIKIETLEKITTNRPPGLLHPYPCTNKKWNSPFSHSQLLQRASSY